MILLLPSLPNISNVLCLLQTTYQNYKTQTYHLEICNFKRKAVRKKQKLVLGENIDVHCKEEIIQFLAQVVINEILSSNSFSKLTLDNLLKFPDIEK